MPPIFLHLCRAIGVGGLLVSVPAFGRTFVGDRFFPSTLTIVDPDVADEISLPTFARRVGTAGEREETYSFEYNKRVTENLGFSIGDAYSRFRPGGSGLRNLELALKYTAYENAGHEFVLSLGAVAEIGGTGARSVAEGFTSLGPQVYFGKGFGDLPASYAALRPIAVTGQVGLLVPTRSRSVTTTVNPDTGDNDVDIDRHPTVLNWGFSLQYSLPYLNAHVREIEGPDLLKRLVPLVEVALRSPVAYAPDLRRSTTGTVNPGVLYQGEAFQLGAEALIPINAASGRHAGFIVQLHVYLDDIFPKTIGKPLFGEEAHEEAHKHAAEHGT